MKRGDIPERALTSLLKRYRAERGITQEELAFKADVTIATLSRIERGVVSPAWVSVAAIAHALDVSLEELGAAVELEDKRLTERDHA
jgi:transcriptional regulator with XRE-family HTH domain